MRKTYTPTVIMASFLYDKNNKHHKRGNRFMQRNDPQVEELESFSLLNELLLKELDAALQKSMTQLNPIIKLQNMLTKDCFKEAAQFMRENDKIDYSPHEKAGTLVHHICELRSEIHHLTQDEEVAYRLLIEKCKVGLNTPDGRDETPLQILIHQGDWVLLDWILKNFDSTYFDCSILNEKKENLLHLILRARKPVIDKTLINLPSDNNNSLKNVYDFHDPKKNLHIDSVIDQLKARMLPHQIDEQDIEGLQPLMHAIINEDIYMANKLCELGARVDLEIQPGNHNIYHFLLKCSSPVEILRSVLKHDPDKEKQMEHKNDLGYPPFINAVRDATPQHVKALRKAGIDFTALKTRHGTSDRDIYVHMIPYNKNYALEMAAYLHKEKFDLTTVRDFENIFHNISRFPYSANFFNKVAQYLPAKIINTLLEGKDANGGTPLHVACAAGHLDTVKSLIKLGAKFSLNREGDTPIHICAINNKDECLKYLIQEYPSFIKTKNTYGHEYKHYIGLYPKNGVGATAQQIEAKPVAPTEISTPKSEVDPEAKKLEIKTSFLRTTMSMGRYDVAIKLMQETPGINYGPHAKGGTLAHACFEDRDNVTELTDEAKVAFKLLIEKSKDHLNHLDKNGLSPLHHIAQNADWLLLDWILTHFSTEYFNFDIRNSLKESILHIIIETRHKISISKNSLPDDPGNTKLLDFHDSQKNPVIESVVDKLLKLMSMKEINSEDAGKGACMVRAMIYNDLFMVKKLCDANVNLDFRVDPFSANIYHFFCKLLVSPAILAYILEKDPNKNKKINELDNANYPPLHYAFYFNVKETVELLKEAGATFSYQPGQIKHLHAAAFNENNLDLLFYLKKEGFKMDETDKNESNFLHIICKNELTDDFLKQMDNEFTKDELKKLVGAKNKDKTTPLHVAAQYGHLKTIKWLLGHGAEIKPDRKANTPIHLSAYMQHEACLKFFKSDTTFSPYFKQKNQLGQTVNLIIQLHLEKKAAKEEGFPVSPTQLSGTSLFEDLSPKVQKIIGKYQIAAQESRKFNGVVEGTRSAKSSDAIANELRNKRSARELDKLTNKIDQIRNVQNEPIKETNKVKPAAKKKTPSIKITPEEAKPETEITPVIASPVSISQSSEVKASIKKDDQNTKSENKKKDSSIKKSISKAKRLKLKNALTTAQPNVSDEKPNDADLPVANVTTLENNDLSFEAPLEKTTLANEMTQEDISPVINVDQNNETSDLSQIISPQKEQSLSKNNTKKRTKKNLKAKEDHNPSIIIEKTEVENIHDSIVVNEIIENTVPLVIEQEEEKPIEKPKSTLKPDAPVFTPGVLKNNLSTFFRPVSFVPDKNEILRKRLSAYPQSEKGFVKLPWSELNIPEDLVDPSLKLIQNIFAGLLLKTSKDRIASHINTGIYLFGSTVPEILSGVTGIKNDIDITLFGVSHEEFAQKIPKSVNRKITSNAEGTKHSVEMYLANGSIIDITCVKDPSELEDNILGRDASATAIAIKYFPTKKVITKPEWIIDFKNKKITCTGDPVEIFAKDPDRKIRVLRLLHKLSPLGFTLDDDVKIAIKKNTGLQSPKPFATVKQIVKLFKEKGVMSTLTYLSEYNLISQIRTLSTQTANQPLENVRFEKLFSFINLPSFQNIREHELYSYAEKFGWSTAAQEFLPRYVYESFNNPSEANYIMIAKLVIISPTIDYLFNLFPTETNMNDNVTAPRRRF